MVRHRRTPIFVNKGAITHADTNITNAGSAQLPGKFNILETEGGARPTSGAEKTITDSRTTGEVCNVGDIIKYVNLFIQCGPRSTATDADERTGWLEWAFCCLHESDLAVTASQTGVLTLGNICKNMYLGECILTGIFPVGNAQCNNVAISIKIPKHKQKIDLGTEWRLITYFRSVKTTAIDSDSVRLIKSFMYKGYN